LHTHTKNSTNSFSHTLISSLSSADELRGLEWHTRFEIIKGICKGLHYLHHNEKGIIHMDLKPLNILLDDNLVPKITDFGISRAGDITKTISQERVCSL
jgi:interleukin-1 receptor-associated kinase 1/coatomer subunit beta'